MTSAIIVAAGKGTRMGANVDKLWLEVAGRPVVAHTWQRFNDSPVIAEIILVVRDGMQLHFTELAEKFHFQKTFRLVVGGAERQDSVWNGLAAVARTMEIVTIQDAARPCTSEALIVATIQAARATGAAVAAHTPADHAAGVMRYATRMSHLFRAVGFSWRDRALAANEAARLGGALQTTGWAR